MLKERYINPFTDFGFKKLFGTEPNKDLLINFLNEVVLPSHQKIADLSYANNEQVGRSVVDRKAIFDLYCVGMNGERFIVEMQKIKQNYFKDRSVYYATFPIQEQAIRGDWDFKLSEVYTVGILDFVFAEDVKEKEVRHEVKLKDQNCAIFYDKLTFIYLEMPHFTKSESELETTYDKWLYVLKHLPSLESRPQKLQERVFAKLFETAEIAHFSPTEMQEYEASLKVYRDLKNSMDTYFGEGKIEGKIERNVEIALNMLKANMDIATISRITEMSEDDIKKLL